jgi:hypothetical protein
VYMPHAVHGAGAVVDSVLQETCAAGKVCWSNTHVLAVPGASRQ